MVTTEEERSFLQQRIALLAKLLFFLSLLFCVLLWVLIAFVPEIGNRQRWVNVFGTLSHLGLMAATWFVVSRFRLGARMLPFADVLPMLAVSITLGVIAVIGWELEPQRYGVIVAGCLVALARVFVVPSTWQRTLLVSILLVLGPALGVLSRAYIPMPGVAASAQGPLAASLLWGTLSSVLAAMGSKVIFGLRREIREARELGQYTLGAKLGEGGMGQVFLARHRLLRRPTAIKILPQEKAGAQAISRFEREVQLTARLTHPNTVSIFDYGRSVDGEFYYAMEYLDGVDLATLVQQHGAQPLGRVVHILRQVASALGEAHRYGLIHRDIKPANIILTEHGGEPDFVKVVDFGLVKDLGSDVQVTLAGGVSGTPAYLAPECLTDPNVVDARADLYALGATAYFLITGGDVFHGRTVVDVLSHHIHSEPEPPTSRLGQPIDPRFETLVLECLEKDPAKRPQAALLIRDRLNALLPHDSWSERRAAEWWQSWRLGRADRRHDFDSGGARLTVGLARPSGSGTRRGHDAS
ncbi:MAG TPA: serine/threonine-protein kinase [Polyangiaceae bacterium]|nr:serine/threonine-protein kinase [Polyangiaceae bacterium]